MRGQVGMGGLAVEEGEYILGMRGMQRGHESIVTQMRFVAANKVHLH